MTLYDQHICLYRNSGLIVNLLSGVNRYKPAVYKYSQSMFTHIINNTSVGPISTPVEILVLVPYFWRPSGISWWFVVNTNLFYRISCELHVTLFQEVNHTISQTFFHGEAISRDESHNPVRFMWRVTQSNNWKCGSHLWEWGKQLD